MKRFYLIITVFIVLLTTGCHKESPGSDQEGNGNVQIVFGTDCLQIDGSTPQRPLNTDTRSGGEAAMAVDTTLRVIVYRKDSAVTKTPAGWNTYKIVDAAGKIAPSAVTAAGKPDTGASAPAEMTLSQGDYDFYYFSPALPVSSGKVSGLDNGRDYMCAKQSALAIKPGPDGKYHVASVQLARLCSRIDLKITPKAGAFIRTLGIGQAGAEISGLPESAEYLLGDAGIASVTGTKGKTSLRPDAFTATGTEASSILTTVGGTGAVVLPVSGRDITVSVNLSIDGIAALTRVTLSSVTLEAGYKYLLELQIDRTGSPAFTLSVQPWTEGQTGGGESGRTYKVGDLRSGGIVYWIDPSDENHYKIVSFDEAAGKTWAEATVWCSAYGQGWSLPSQAELQTLYQARRDNGGAIVLTDSSIDKSIVFYSGTAFGTGAYRSSTRTDASNAQSVKLSDGSSSPASDASKLSVRAVRELPAVVSGISSAPATGTGRP